jgi:hypothetical protein
VGINRTWIRALGLAGMVGGILFFAGDMLFYYSSTTDAIHLTMGHCSDTRIIASAVAGLFGTWLYVLGAGQVLAAFRTTSATVRNLVVGSLVAIFIAYGVVHGAYVAIAATAKLAVENSLDVEEATAFAVQANNVLRLFIYPIFGLLSYLFITRVWMRETLYPRWMILFFPLIPFLLQGFVDQSLSGTAWVVIAGGYFNLILVVFFAASTVALWNPEPAPSDR